MSKLSEFTGLLAGRFNNAEQFAAKQKSGQPFPYAEHLNTVCNDKILHLPPDFAGVFMVEESYYTTDGKTHPAHHLFLFTEEEAGIRLTSYEVPVGYGKDSFTYANLRPVAYADLVRRPEALGQIHPGPLHREGRRLGGRQRQPFQPGADLYPLRAVFQRVPGSDRDDGNERQTHLRLRRAHPLPEG